MNVARAGSGSFDQNPSTSPPDQTVALWVPVSVAPVINMGAVGARSQRFISPPAEAVGSSPQLIVRVLVGFVPAHVPLPVTVRVAVKLPLLIDGVNVARAGSAFCDHVPEPPPPDQTVALWVPVSVAPVIKIGFVGVAVHRFIFPPAAAVGVWAQLIVLVSVSKTPPHEALPVTVSVAVKLPLVTVGVNVARAGSGSWVHAPRPTPPDQSTAL